MFAHAVEKGLSFYYDDSDTMFFDHTGAPITKQMKTHRVVYDCACKISQIYQDLSYLDMSLKDSSEQFVQTYPLIDDVNKKLGPQMMRQLELWHGIPWERISSKYGLMEETGRDAFITSGYDSVLKMLCSDSNLTFEDLNISLNEEVINISKVPKNNTRPGSYKKDIQVVTTKGTYVSDFAICTIPVAVLQKRLDTLLDASLNLSSELLSVIKGAEIACLGKVVLEFDQVFWHKDIDRFIVLGSDSPDLVPGSCPIFFSNGHCVFGKPVLIALTAPPLTQFLEANRDKIVEYLQQPLEALRVDKNLPIPDIKKTIVTDWSLNPFALGSYSALRVGQDYYNCIYPFENGSGNLRFAGEHTVSEGNGCVHGAVRSGAREASHILGELKDSSS